MSTSRDYASIYDSLIFRINQNERLDILTKKEARHNQLVEMYAEKKKERFCFYTISELLGMVSNGKWNRWKRYTGIISSIWAWWRIERTWKFIFILGIN